MARPIVALLVAVAASLVALPSEAQWKWKDKSGHVQYSDLPPPAGTADQDILARPSPTARRSAPIATTGAPVTGAASTTPVAAASAPRNAADAELEAKRKKA